MSGAAVSGTARAGRTLVVFPGALGDFVLLAPALAALAAAGLQLELSVRRPLAELACAVFPGSAAPPVDGAAMASLFAAELDPAIAGWLRGAARVDFWLGRNETPERHARVLGVPRVRGHEVERGDAGVHASVAYARALGVAAARVEPRALDAWLAGASARPRPRALVLHPGAGAPAKRWTVSGFRRVADAWQERGGEAFVLLGPAEEDGVARWRAAGHEIAVGLGLRDAAALIASAPWYLGNDCGMSHLAGLLGRRGAVLFGPTRAARWRPVGGALEPISWTGVAEEEIARRVISRLTILAGDHLDTPTPRH